MRILAVSATLALLAAIQLPALAGPRDASAAADRAEAAYLAGRYPDALPDLEKAREGGAAAGMHLYMLGFCYDNVRHDAEASRKAYADAKDKLEAEVKGKKPALESYFYLSNLYINLNDRDASQKIAKEATSAIAARNLKVAKDGTSQFRAGKLHTDAGLPAQALEYYRRAVKDFSSDKNPPPAYYERSLEPLAREELGRGDAAAVSSMWEKLLSLNTKVTDGDWNLGLAALRAGRYAVSRDAFKRARIVSGAGTPRSQEAYYAESLANNANSVVVAGFSIPVKDDDGQVFAAMALDTLTERLSGFAKKASVVLSRDMQEDEFQVLPPVNAKARPRLMPTQKLSTEITEAERRFCACAIAKFLKTQTLQEDAFTGGYAPLVIQEWLSLWRSNHHAIIDEAVKNQPPPGKPAGAPAGTSPAGEAPKSKPSPKKP